MYIVETWKGRYFKKSGGTKRPPKTVDNKDNAKRFQSIDEIQQKNIKGKIHDVG